MDPLHLNEAAWRRVLAMTEQAQALRIGVSRGAAGELLIDAGGLYRGGVAAGLRLAEICLGGLGTVTLGPDAAVPEWPWTLAVASSQPVIGCLASQYAGWSLAEGAFFALGSGPARALAQAEELFAELGYAETAAHAVLVLEAGGPPPESVVRRVADACSVAPENLAVAFAPTQSLAGGVQVVSRVLEVAMHKAHALHFPLHRIVDGLGCAPLPPPHPDFVTAMGRTNDAIIFAGRVHLFVTGPDADARELAERLPAAGSRDYGRPFAETFNAVGGDFYRIDPMLFSPALAAVTAVESGATFRAGAIAPDLIGRSFG